MGRRVVVVVFDGLLLLDVAGPIGALEVAGYYVEDGYAIELTSANGGMVRSSAGVTVETMPFVAGLAVDLMIVPGGPGSTAAAAAEPVLALIREVSSQSRRSASVCSGAFLLAAAGILKGKRATTHWGGVGVLRRDYPEVTVDSDSIFIEDGNVWTSAGITTGIDLALAWVERDHGFAVAQQVAQGLVVYHRRPGGQHQFSAALELQGPDGRFGPLLDWARERLHERLNVERLAGRCGLSPRHFSRAFATATGSISGKSDREDPCGSRPIRCPGGTGESGDRGAALRLWNGDSNAPFVYPDPRTASAIFAADTPMNTPMHHSATHGAKTSPTDAQLIARPRLSIVAI